MTCRATLNPWDKQYIIHSLYKVDLINLRPGLEEGTLKIQDASFISKTGVMKPVASRVQRTGREEF